MNGAKRINDKVAGHSAPYRSDIIPTIGPAAQAGKQAATFLNQQIAHRIPYRLTIDDADESRVLVPYRFAPQCQTDAGY